MTLESCDLCPLYRGYSQLSKYEQDLVREDALAALYTWITDLSKTGNPEIWSLAGIL